MTLYDVTPETGLDDIWEGTLPMSDGLQGVTESDVLQFLKRDDSYMYYVTAREADEIAEDESCVYSMNGEAFARDPVSIFFVGDTQ